MGRVGRLFAGLLLAFFGVVFAWAVLEVGVRALHLFPADFWQPDPLLGARHIPGKEGWWTQEEDEFKAFARINSRGLHDVEHSLEKPAGVYRILLLGDSYVEALQVPLEKSIGRQLEQRLNALGKGRFEVVSMGVSGYGTASELLYYLHEGRSYHPDLVLLAFYPGNDVRDNSDDLEGALQARYAADGELLRVVPGTEPPSRPRRGQGLFHRLLASSQAYRYVRKLLLTRQPQLAAMLARAGLIRREAVRQAPEQEGIPLDYWVYAQPPPPQWQTAWRHSEDLLGRLRAATQADGARFAIFLVTARDRVYPDGWRQIVAAHPNMAAKRWDFDAPDRRVLAWCDKNDVPCLPLYPEFAAHRDDGPRLHFVYDGHWTAAGHALAARSVAKFLEQKGLLTSP
jgi:SGNH hydrolase-like domain, acetyltransferase AlgX